MSSDNNIFRPDWAKRRRVIYATLLFSAFCVSYIMFQGNDTRINETIVYGCFTLAGAVIGFYVAGASWEDVNIHKWFQQGNRGNRTTTTQNTITEQQPVSTDES